MNDSSANELAAPPKVLPPHYFLFSLAVIGALGWWADGRLLARPWPFLGILPALVGLVVASLGSRQFSKAGTNIIPLTRSSALVTDGVFAVSRNPMYLGMILFLAGACIVANTLSAWLVPVCFFFLIKHRFILREEALMEETFGAAYSAYQAKVRRWL